MKPVFLLLLILFNLGFMNKTEAKNDLNKLSWIIGRWVSENGDSKSYEQWTKVNDTLYEGSSETIKNGDTTFTEKLKIQKTGNDIFYTADVKHNPAPVNFKLVSADDDEAVFENMEHDFPKRITYKSENGNLHAWIEGPGKTGEWIKIDFFMALMR